MSATMPGFQKGASAAIPGPMRIAEIVVRAIIVSVGFAAVFIALSVCYEVFVRSALGQPVIWVEEITSYLVGFITFVGMGAALYRGAHVDIEFITQRLTGLAGVLMALLVNTLMLALACMLLDMSWVYWSDAWTSGERSTSLLSVPLWIPYLCLLIGSVIFLLIQLFLTITTVIGLWRTQSDHREPRP